MFKSEELTKRLQPLIKDQADMMWQAFLVSDDNERELIHHSLEILHDQFIDNYKQEKVILSPPFKWEHLEGDYPLGMVMYPSDTTQYPFFLQEEELTQHLAIFGRTGSGKSFFTKGLLLTQIKRNIPFLLFDWKGTYKDIQNNQTILFEPGSKIHPFHFNPLDLEGIQKEHHKTYIRQIVELLLECYFENLRLLTVEGVESLLLRAIDDLSVKHDAITFTNIYNWIDAFEGKMREMDWKASALNLLYKLNTGPLNSVINKTSSNLNDLLQQMSIFELHNIGSSKDKSFFIKSLLLKLHYYFRQQGPSKRLKLLIVIEEAHNILIKKNGSETILDLMLRECREFGIGFIILDQHPSTLSLSALGSYGVIGFHLKLKQDRESMASALNLEHQEILGRLPPRYAIVKLSGRYLHPFLIQTFDLTKTHDQVPKKKKRMPQPTHTHKPLKGFEGLLGVLKSEHKTTNKTITTFADQNPVVDGIKGIEGSKEVIRACEVVKKSLGKQMLWEEIFLCHMYTFPLMPAMERYHALGINSYQGNKYKNRLAKRDFIQVQKVSTSKGRIKLMVPTQKGFNWLKSRGFSAGKSDKEGGMMHKYWIRRLRDQFTKMGLSTIIEAHIGQQNCVDLQVGNKKKNLGVEIETGCNDAQQVIANINKCVQHFGYVVSLILNQNKYKKLREACKDKRVAIVSDEAMCVHSVMKSLGDAV